MTDELMKRIESALDAPGGLESDAELRAMLASDPEARAYADDLVRIGERLSAMGRAPDVDWEKLAARIEARLDEPLDDLDVLGAPVFEDELADRRAPMVSQEVPVAAAPAKVVDLSERRAAKNAAFYWMGGLAAAAAVGLGIVLGTQTMGGEEEAAVSMAPAPAADVLAEEAEPAAEAVAMQQPAVQRAAQPMAPPEPAPLAAEPMPRPIVMAPERGGDGFARGAAGGAPGPGLAADRVEAVSMPSRAVIVNALAAANEAVARCIMNTGARTPADVHVRVRADGSFESVTIDPPYTGTPEGACIERAIRALDMPPAPAPYVGGNRFFAQVAAGSVGRNLRPAARMRAAREAAPPPPQAQPQPARRPAQQGAEMVNPWAE